MILSDNNEPFVVNEHSIFLSLHRSISSNKAGDNKGSPPTKLILLILHTLLTLIILLIIFFHVWTLKSDSSDKWTGEKQYEQQ